MNIFKWFHHAVNPHCPDCKFEEQENKICSSCETLKSELAAVRHENKQLMDAILQRLNPEPVAPVIQAPVEVGPRNMTWRVRKQMLEENDRRAAQVLREKKNEMYETSKTTEQLEKELLGEENAVRPSDAQVQAG